ncbi:MAG TPA: sigma-70 family RNA polymerase sigma factor, partial [Myxococcales bacterium]|nr:sigma-70 family RNA polymerase sigma factor [Myxococcales bacterium]
DAVEAALKGLSPKERNFLRLYFVEGLTVEQIGAMQGAHKSTVSRWLARARETVGTQVRQLLGDRLHLSAGDLDSLMGLLQSELELSLLRVL